MAVAIAGTRAITGGVDTHADVHVAAGAGTRSRAARKDYQACRYAELVSRLPRLLSQLDTACRRLTGDDQLRACALSADAYHVTAGFLLKTGDQGLAHVATDWSMTAALASQDPLTVGASGRIVTHTLMSSGHLTAAVTTAQNHAVRLDHATGPRHRKHYPCTARCCCAAPSPPPSTTTAPPRRVLAGTTARRLGADANLRGTAFGPVNTQMHRAARHEHLAASYRAMRDHYQQQGQALAQTMADRQALKVTIEDPGWSGLDTLFSAPRRLGQAAILQPPKPPIVPSTRILERAAEHDVEPEAGG